MKKKPIIALVRLESIVTFKTIKERTEWIKDYEAKQKGKAWQKVRLIYEYDSRN